MLILLSMGLDLSYLKCGVSGVFGGVFVGEYPILGSTLAVSMYLRPSYSKTGGSCGLSRSKLVSKNCWSG